MKLFFYTALFLQYSQKPLFIKDGWFQNGRYKTQVTGHRSGHRSQVTGHRAQGTGHRKRSKNS